MATVAVAPIKSAIKRGVKPGVVQQYVKKSTRRVEIATSAEERFTRLNRHHEAMKLCLGGLYPCPEKVEAILAPTPGETKRILDIGCGSRIWAIEMAKQFPHAEVVGLDVPQSQEQWEGEYPPNCSFRSVDFLFSLPKEYLDQFDLIHLRFICSAFAHFQNSMDDIEMCLKPGGMILVVDSTGEVIAEDRVTVVPMRSKPFPNGSQLQRLFHEIRHANSSLGLDEFMMRATLQDGLWDSSLDDCGAAEMLMPIGPWIKDPNPTREGDLQFAGSLFRESLRVVQQSHLEMLRNLCLPPDVAERWQTVIDAELSNPNLKTFLDVRYLWGRRRANEDSPAPPLPSLLTKRGSTSASWHASPLVHRYKTQEGWQSVTEKRQKKSGTTWRPDPTPYVYHLQNQKRRHSTVSSGSISPGGSQGPTEAPSTSSRTSPKSMSRGNSGSSWNPLSPTK